MSRGGEVHIYERLPPVSNPTYHIFHVNNFSGLQRVWKKKYKSFNFGPISNLKPPISSAENQKHTYMSKKILLHHVRRGEPPVRDLLTKYIQLHLTSSGRLPPPNLVNPKIFLDISVCSWCSAKQFGGFKFEIGPKLNDLYIFFQTVKNKEYGQRK